MNKDELIKLGSETAKNGFKNEQDVVDRFNNWQKDNIAQEWLLSMNYNIQEIEYVKAEKIKGSFKADIQVSVSITIKLKNLIDYQNIQVKLVSNKKGFNQIDKRWLSKYKEMWGIPDNIYELLSFYTGEQAPYKANTKDSRRMFMHEFTSVEERNLLDFLSLNKTLIISDILKGRGKFSAEWMLVILKDEEEMKWTLHPMNKVLNYYSQGDVVSTKRGSIHIGRITMQRKGGDGGRPTANMLQFKIDPTELFDF